ncbi:unnamed protein product [Rotaria sp. Silwood2]|nr:unnamed protein product [Rotaria sp. Silwood2]CAF2834590.1 unnamed protein product [Rotaria sp. Silwood2]CAF3132151.1 unnamed protein product [Rotaria sp. Silwood2]
MRDNSSIHIYLIISMSKFQNIQTVVELNPVHAVSVVADLEPNELMQKMPTYPKLSGIFLLNEDLLDQLITYICFYRQLRLRLPNVNIFRLELNILDNLNEYQVNSLCFQLFSDILSDLPIDSSTTTYRNAWNDDHLLSNLIEANTNINYLFKDFNIPTLRNSVTTLKEINQRIVSLAENVDPSSNTVYRAQVVLTTDFKMLQDNPNTLLAIQGFILASRSSHSIVDVCRQAVDNQLNAVLLGLKLFDQASIVDLDPHTVIFSLGTLFRLISTESAPDSVWHAQLESTNGTMESITDRLRFEIGGHFTWLTFGHYLTTFKRYDAAKNYYEYLLFVLPSNHSCLPSIYNNMGLMYAEMKNNRKALEFFQKASKSLVNDLSIATEQSYLHTLRVLSPQSSFVNNIKILNKIAEISYLQGNKKTALEYYRRALSMEPDAVSREL